MTNARELEDQTTGDNYDVAVIGAGVAGLVCARTLAEHGRRVCVVEAQSRVGGRILTQSVNGQIIELGAEFVHGRPPELLELLQEAGLTMCERTGTHLSFEGEAISEDQDQEEEERFQPLEDLRNFSGQDLSFAEYLAGSRPALSDALRESALGYVEGFNAADAAQISSRSLGVQQAAEEAIDGNRVAHVHEGYARLPEFLAAKVSAAGGELRLGVRVDAVHWGTHRVALETSSGEILAKRTVVTLPLGILHAGTVRIVPEPRALLAAAAQMRMGPVCRFTMLFHERFWLGLPPQPAMSELSFLFDLGELPSVWWTTHPEAGRTLTGWVGGPRATALLGKSEQDLADLAVVQIARLFSLKEERVRSLLESCRTHDWSADPCFLGAYSYVAVGGVDASRIMSEPVERTLFFAGEHTDTTGHWGTVHGALRSGIRAAHQILSEP